MEINENAWKWLGRDGKGRKWMNRAGSYWKRLEKLEMTGKWLKGLEIAKNGS